MLAVPVKDTGYETERIVVIELDVRHVVGAQRAIRRVFVVHAREGRDAEVQKRHTNRPEPPHV